ncbi:hypothetical protein C356_03335 [Cryptococcus neoformans c45]|nr:hypothetical protein C356_03335 [Cryptococcus neoformans var. grubii c45]
MVVLDYVTVAKFISDRILHDGGLKLSTREDFPTWNDTIISALTYARSAATAPGTFDADIDQLIREHIRETLTISLRPNYSHYTTAAAAL